MEKLDRDITQTEQQIANLKKKKVMNLTLDQLGRNSIEENEIGIE